MTTVWKRGRGPKDRVARFQLAVLSGLLMDLSHFHKLTMAVYDFMPFGLRMSAIVWRRFGNEPTNDHLLDASWLLFQDFSCFLAGSGCLVAEWLAGR